MYSFESLGTILIFVVGSLLVGLIFKQKVKPLEKGDSTVSEAPVEKKKVSIMDKWSVRLTLVGLGLGVFASISQGYASPKHIGFMIGFGIPLALILGFIGLVIDFFKRKK
jgi:hypothetical protein